MGLSRQCYHLLRERSGLPWLREISQVCSFDKLPPQKSSQTASYPSHVPQRQTVFEFSSGDQLKRWQPKTIICRIGGPPQHSPILRPFKIKTKQRKYLQQTAPNKAEQANEITSEMWLYQDTVSDFLHIYQSPQTLVCLKSNGFFFMFSFGFRGPRVCLLLCVLFKICSFPL